jgi:CheY-like chemotaxis protein
MIFVLLVEDNKADVFLVEEALREAGIRHVLHVIKNGEEAADFVARMGKPGEVPCPDVMLLDLNLPEKNGEQILAEFRKQPECANVPVIAVSSSDAPYDPAQLVALGVSRYFRKPSDVQGFMKLGALVRELVASHACEEDNWSGRQDSNLRPPGPEPGTLPG